MSIQINNATVSYRYGFNLGFTQLPLAQLIKEFSFIQKRYKKLFEYGYYECQRLLNDYLIAIDEAKPKRPDYGGDGLWLFLKTGTRYSDSHILLVFTVIHVEGNKLLIRHKHEQSDFIIERDYFISLISSGQWMEVPN